MTHDAEPTDTFDDTPTPSHMTELLFREVGFLTPDVAEANAAVTAGLTDPMASEVAIRQAWTELSKIVEGIIESQASDEARAKAYIAAIINRASIFRTVGNLSRYLEEMDGAEVLACNARLDDVSAALTAEIDKICDEMEPSPEVLIVRLKGYISEGSRERLWRLFTDGDDMQDILSSAFGMLIDEGEDPDEVFGAIGVSGA